MAGSSRPIYDFLREHRGGKTADELADALQELVAAVVAEGKGGTLTLKISVKPSGKTGGLEVSDDIKLSPPREVKSASIFFASPENNLVRQDPRQSVMELREIGPSVAHVGVA